MQCISLKIILFAFVSSFVVKLSEAQTYTFTNAGAEGREGPTQAQIDQTTLTPILPMVKSTINTRGIHGMGSAFQMEIMFIEAYGAQVGEKNLQEIISKDSSRTARMGWMAFKLGTWNR